ncbi:MAG: endonuclease V [Methanolinea sp.]|nr:endonuclease V [Methanolinea sp.]
MRDDPGPSFREEARRLQEVVARYAAGQEPADTSGLRTVGGADVSYEGDNACACVVVMEYGSLRERTRAAATSKAKFPYVPGYFAFREIPAILAALRLVPELPDLFLVHGHGYAHPKRAGIATHLGVLLDVPTIGVAGNLLSGMEADAPPDIRGATSPVTMGGEVVGSLLRTCRNKAPLCVSPGFRTTLPEAISIVLHCTTDHRFPEPLHLADRCAGRFRKEVYRENEKR